MCNIPYGRVPIVNWSHGDARISGIFQAEDIEEILAEIDGSQIEGRLIVSRPKPSSSFSEYQKFFDAFDRGKQGYIMATQIGQIMHGMEQDFDEKVR